MIKKNYIKFFSLFRFILIIFMMSSCPSPENNNEKKFYSPLEGFAYSKEKKEEINDFIRDGITQKKMRELILESEKIDTSDIYVVAQKFISILKQAQKPGTCTLFSPHGLLLADPNMTNNRLFQPYYTVFGVAKGKFIMHWLDKLDKEKVSASSLFNTYNESHKILLEYNNFSLDGKYSVTGKLKLIQDYNVTVGKKIDSLTIFQDSSLNGKIRNGNIWVTTDVDTNERTFIMKGPGLPQEGVSMIFPDSTDALFKFNIAYSCGKANAAVLPGLTNEYNSIIIDNGDRHLKLYTTSKDNKVKSLLEFLFSKI